MTMKEAAQFWRRRHEVKEMWLTHYSPSMIHPEWYLDEVREVFPRTCLGKDGKFVELQFEGED